MNSTLLISVATIKSLTQLHANVDEALIYPEIDNVQEIYLKPLIGTTLLERLKAGVEEGDLTDAENTLIDKYINKVLAYYTLSELPEGLSIQFFSSGAVGLKSSNTEKPTFSDLISMAKRLKAKGDFYAAELVKYLKQHASTTLFPQYLNPGTGRDTTYPGTEDYSCEIFLG